LVEGFTSARRLANVANGTVGFEKLAKSGTYDGVIIGN
jgi:hypothetical protein